uniref:Zinc finger CCCH domain-containing protein 19-like isoform X2 n=1 Tax=Rhizophora mucronata TaxID=61149 RepID=A0A2P2KU02_RHIMU
MGKKKGSKELKFIGWGSKPLIEFLRSLGQDTSKELSQYEIDSIISSYIRKRNLSDPKNRKKVVCDESLYSIFRRKSLDKNKIYSLLEAHLVMNLDISEDDENGDEHESNLHDTDDQTMSTSKKRRLVCSNEKSQMIERDSNVQASCFASIVAQNIKLIYLRRSLVEELLDDTDNFSAKVEGSFVKVKMGCRDFIRKNSHQLLQVTGVKQISTTGENKSETVLSLFNTATEVSISMLSDSDLSEEEIEDLRQSVEIGLLPKFTVMELEQKARSLHEDITKHWIKKELTRLQNCIDFANEKGWRREYPCIVKLSCEHILSPRLLQIERQKM